MYEKKLENETQKSEELFFDNKVRKPEIEINPFNSVEKIENDKVAFIEKKEYHEESNKIINDLLQKKNMLKILFLISIIIIFFFYFKIDEYITLDNITEKEHFTTRNKAIRKGLKYVEQCLKGQLINNQTFQVSNNPKITMIIPVYKTGDFIKYVVRSIQNQNILNIEIILINDFSNDNNYTLNIIEKIQEEDPRIILINNKKNMGILYSRSIGALQSKGEYIMTLDHDDFILDEDVFDTSYKAAKNGDFDIISFLSINAKEYNPQKKDVIPSDIKIPHNHIVLQPELSIYTFFENDKFHWFDYTIWGKLYKNSIYKKAVNFLTYERYSVYVAYNEDFIGVFAICNVAESYKFIRKYGVFHRDYEASTSHTEKQERRVFSDIFFSEIIVDLAKNQFKKYSIVFLELRVYISSEENNKYLIKVINKIKDCEYIEEKFKESLKIKFGKLMENQK